MITISFDRIKNKNILNKFLFLLSFAITVFLLFFIHKNNILPLRYRAYGGIFFAVLYLAIGIIVFKNSNFRGSNIFVRVLLILISIVSVFANLYVSKGVDAYKTINEKQYSESYTFSLVVRNDSSFNSLEDILDVDVESALAMDESNISHFIDAFKNENDMDINLVEGNDYITMAKDLLEENSEIMLLNEAFRPIIEEQFKNFSIDTRVLKPTVIEKDSFAELEQETVAPNKGFNVFISGIDTYGNISSVARSDVNIILSINPSTNKILITSIPRDTYTKISGGGNDQYDKLTHSGIYGVISSVDTVENLLDIDISYYVKVNFSSVVKLIDVIGGIDIDNPVAFKSGNMYFEKGNIHLSGERALRYSRERYKFAEGDVYRGQNQVRVIQGIINKMMSPSILLNYHRVLDVVEEFSETNIPFEKITELVNYQIEYNGKWDFDSIQLKGSGTRELSSYAMPGWVQYMHVPDEDSIGEIHGRISDVIK
ncbi:MAG: transcriptional regulator [Tissierellia bacterium]|nr:transcriptional regulator [Tissierellia bacterium]